MDHHVSSEILAELAEARSAPKDRRHRLRIEVEGGVFPVIRAWNGGFVVSKDDCPNLRGFVDLFDGGKHLASCLVMCAKDDGHVMRYEYKRVTKAQKEGARDFATAPSDPVAYLAR